MTRLLRNADVVKLNEEELERVQEFSGLPRPPKHSAAKEPSRYGWQAVCVTLGARGCAILAHGDYVESQGHAVAVADAVGAGDAFAAAFMHGLISEWSAAESQPSPIASVPWWPAVTARFPQWTLEEAVAL